MSINPVDSVGLSGAQVALLALILGGLLGIAGLSALCITVWFSHQRFGIDRSAKHGISVKDTSRMGGTAIAVFLVVFWVVSTIFPWFLDKTEPALTVVPSFLLVATLLGCIGFLDDIGVSLTPFVRLLSSIFILTISFIMVPNWMPNQVIALAGLTSSPIIESGLTILSVFVCIGFINAGNMADGANGLFGGVCLSFFLCAWMLTNEGLYFSVILGLVSFFIINVFTGRIIMGDFGSYGLSGLIVLVSFELFDQALVGIAFLALLLSYPCLEIVRIFVVRIDKGQSPFHADNQHSHNMLNHYFLSLVKSKTYANSLTGVSIASASVLPAWFIFYQGEQLNELLCGGLFLFESVVFFGLHWCFACKRT